MKYIGLGLLVMAAALISSWYKRRLRERVDTLGALVRVVEHIGSRVSGYLEPPASWSKDFSSGSEAVDGFLRLVAEGVGVAEAYEQSSDGLSLSEEAGELLEGFFSSLGRSQIGEERQNIDRVRTKLTALWEAERAEGEERGRIAAVMALMLSAGGAILII